MTKTPGANAGALAADGSIVGWQEGSKLKMFDFSLNWASPYTVLGGMVGVAFFKVCQYTTDHEFVQRQLACRDVKQASMSLVWSQLISLPIVLVFLLIGSLLFVKYKSEFLATGNPSQFFTDARDIFPQYIKNHIPMGVRGLMITGLLAAALSSFNSAINAMASSFVTDLYLPIRADKGKAVKGDAEQLSSSRKMVFLMGMLLTGFAIVTAVMQEASGLNLVDFATGVMCFAYAGMIGVFLTAIFTKRGNTTSVVAAIVVGALIIIPLMFQKQIFGTQYIAWTWWAPIGGIISTTICMLGKPEKK
jgi:Na+/proline symporter